MTRQFGRIVLAALTAATLAGCAGEDARFKKLTVGISKDSAFSALGVKVKERPASYLVNGQLIEIAMVRRPQAEGPLDSLTKKQYAPMVTIGGKLAGWGWKYWDSLAGANKIVH